jgi:heme/copper-type cytochrome/quinol oxidase subunit 2
MSRARILDLAPFAGLALLVLLAPWPFTPAPVTRDVTLAAAQFAFDPPVLRVNRGDRVRLTLRATDVVHGFHLDHYGIDTRVEPGLSRRVEFVADRPGKFRYRCSVSCGLLHPFMTGELVVSPNLAFIRAVGLTLVALAATLFSLRRRPPAGPGTAR